MAQWKHRVKIKHLFTDEDNHDSIQKTMNSVADILEKNTPFRHFDCSSFRNIPEGDDVFGPSDYAQRYLDRMYDYADLHRIWIE
jgi:hypothetical protein